MKMNFPLLRMQDFFYTRRRMEAWAFACNQQVTCQISGGNSRKVARFSTGLSVLEGTLGLQRPKKVVDG